MRRCQGGWNTLRQYFVTNLLCTIVCSNWVFADSISFQSCKHKYTPKPVNYSLDFSLFPRHIEEVRGPHTDVDSWYGFYYPSPWNSDGTMHLTTERKKLQADAPVALYVVNGDGTRVRLGETSAFNTAEGARLQWIAPDTVIYNVRSESGFAAKVVQVSGPNSRERGLLPYPVYSISKDGKVGTSLNFARTYCFSSEGTYGYRPDEGTQTKEISTLVPSDDGVTIFDLDPASLSTRVRTTISPTSVIDLLINEGACLSTGQQAGGWLRQAYVWLEQPKLSSDGQRVLFIARSKQHKPGDSVDHLHARPYVNLGIFTVDLDGRNLWYAEGYPVSHFDFFEKELMLCGDSGMAVIRDTDGSGLIYKSNVHSVDGHADMFAGHCTYNPKNRNFILTDTSCTKCTRPCQGSPSTCPNGQLGRYVGVLDTRVKKLYVLAMFSVDISVPENLFIDLHPRFSPDGKKIMVDGQFTGKARQYLLDIGELLHQPTLAAIMFEINCTPHFEKSLLSAAVKLPLSVTIYITVSSVNKDYISRSKVVKKLVQQNRVKLVNVEPLVTHSKKWESSKVKQFFTFRFSPWMMGRLAMRSILFNPSFWSLFPEDFLLWFHVDTFFCDSSEEMLWKLLEESGGHPYLGPENPDGAAVGGISLRQRSAFVDAARALQNQTGILHVGEDVAFGRHFYPSSLKEPLSLGNTYFLHNVKDSVKRRNGDFSKLIGVHHRLRYNELTQTSDWKALERACPGIYEFYHSKDQREHAVCS